MALRLQAECVRGVWEGRCAVEGCGCLIRLEGPWTMYPETPRFFHKATGRTGALEGGWWYLHRGYLSYRAGPKVHYNTTLMCPDHAQAWMDYCDAVDNWKNEERRMRKTWWQTLTAPFREPEPARPPMPTPPFLPRGEYE